MPGGAEEGGDEAGRGVDEPGDEGGLLGRLAGE